MSTSGSYDFNETRNEIIEDALVRLGVIREGGTVPAATYTRLSRILNKMVKHWQKVGIHVWAETEGTLFLNTDQAIYPITGSGNKMGDDVIETTISSSSAGTTLTVTSTLGMTPADQIGVELDDGTRQFTTILTVDSLTTLTLNTSIITTASPGNTVFTYTSESTKPMTVSSIRYRDISGTDVPVNLIGRDEFMALSDKSMGGASITNAFLAINRTSATVYVWPVPEDCQGRLKISYSRGLQDFDSSNDNPDFPSEWLETITLNLAVKAAPIYRIKPSDIQDIISDARQSLADMKLNDLTVGSIQIVPADRDTY